MNPNLLLYFIGSISQNDPTFMPVRKAMVREMQQHGRVLDEHVVRDDALAFEEEERKRGVNVNIRDNSMLDRAKAAVAEISTATTGGGGEIVRKASSGAPVFVTHHRDARGSWYINSMPAAYPNVQYQTYGSIDEAVGITRTFLQGLPKPNPGKVIVIDGTDGSGKASQTKILVARMLNDGLRVKTESFPTYGRDSCKGVEWYLNGNAGNPIYVGPFYGSMFYAFNRFKETGQMKEDLKNGIHYVLDRYVSANVGHQGGKIDDPRERDEYIQWLFDLEYRRFKIPEPDLTIFLHTHPVVGQQLLAGKTDEERAYILNAKKRDIHEIDVDHLRKAEESYFYVAGKYPGWRLVDCIRPELIGREDLLSNLDVPVLTKVRPLQEINDEIYSHVKEVLIE